MKKRFYDVYARDWRTLEVIRISVSAASMGDAEKMLRKTVFAKGSPYSILAVKPTDDGVLASYGEPKLRARIARVLQYASSAEKLKLADRILRAALLPEDYEAKRQEALAAKNHVNGRDNRREH